MTRKLILLGITGTVLLALFTGLQPGVQAVQAARAKPIVHLVRAIDTSPQGVTFQTSVAVDGRRNVYVIDGTPDNPRVLKYDKQGRFLLEWGGKGSGPGQFEFWPPTPDGGPNGGFIAVDSQGYVYVSDAFNTRIQKFDSNGNFVLQFGEPGTGEGQFAGGPGPLYVDNQDHIWVSTFPRVMKFDSQGHFLVSYGSAGSGPGQFTGAAMGTIDSQGNMYIADLLNARVQKLDANGQFLMEWGTPGTGPGQFFFPVGVVLDDKGRLYVVDNSNRIQVFTTDGQYIGQWSEPGKGYPPFGFGISGLAIDWKGDIYVADWPNPAIYVFRTRPK